MDYRLRESAAIEKENERKGERKKKKRENGAFLACHGAILKKTVATSTRLRVTTQWRCPSRGRGRVNLHTEKEVRPKREVSKR